MKEKEIIDMIVAGYPWEQVIYKIVAVEAMDPWDMDIAALSSSLLKCLSKMKEMDFKIPAKYLIIAAVLLKMKSDHLQFIELLHEDETENQEDFEDEMDMFEMDNMESDDEGDIKPNIDILADAFNLREKRIHKRKVMFEELIESLRKAMKTEKRRERRKANAIVHLNIEREDISKRIEDLYKRIDFLLEKINKEEVEFSKLVKEWKREEIIRTFMPLIYLENERKVNCRQDKIFDKIFIKKAE